MTRIDGDRALATRLRFTLDKHHPIAAVATARNGITSAASVGASLGQGFEIGSLSKGITGLLYADACSRGEISPQTTLGELLPLSGCPAAGLTLAALSTHRSGLPRLPRSAHPLQRTIALWRDGTNPYGDTLDEVLAQSRTVTLSAPRPRYSNLGFELLGHAVAAGAGLGYTELLAERLTGPLGMTDTYAPKDPTGLRPTALVGTNRAGRPVEPWTGEALAPAGGIRSSISDLAVLASALADGSAPGIGALDPAASFGNPAVRIGAGWFILEGKGFPVTMHNGATGGFRSWLGVDRVTHTAVVLLTATNRSPDAAGFRWLRELTAAADSVRT